MKTDEAIDYPKPQKPRNEAEVKKDNTISKLYLFLIFLLCIIFAVVSFYDIALFKSNKKVNAQIKTSYYETKSARTENKVLRENNNILAKENSTLKEQFEILKQENLRILKELSDIKKQNEEISNKNKELTEDNIELQNSLKMAAAEGIKPQNFTRFNGLTSRGEIDRGKYVGKFLGTAYTPSALECGNSKGITNSGKPVIAGVSIAVDGRYWPFGTVFYIKGLGYAVAMDTGSAIKGENRFDFAVFDRGFAKRLGSKYWEVYLVKKGNGKIENIEF